MESIDITIIGGGVTGLASALYLTEKYPDKTIMLVEKNAFLGEEQSGRNSGIRHSSIQYKPGSLKAKFCVEGNRLITEFCKKYDVPYADTGKLTVATTLEDIAKLDFYYERAVKNGAPGVRKLTKGEIKEFEPNIEGLAAVYTPSTGIVDGATYIKTMKNLLGNTDAIVFDHTKVLDVKPQEDGFVVKVDQAGEVYEFKSEIVVNAAGLFADELTRMVNPEFPYKIKPLRGEFMKFNKNKRPELFMKGMPVYKIPQPIPGGMLDEHGEPKTTSGTHFTPCFDFDASGKIVISNFVHVGPFQVPINNKSDYESNRAPPEAFVKDLKILLPGLRVEDLEQEFTGIQTKIEGYDDWILERDKKYRNLVTAIIDSPGFTASQAVGKEISELVDQIYAEKLELASAQK
ncbi:NAD(P)/FAD-dependent oxidoreductase [archaeon]|nr:NAD(P)/FAD-dependent oxidoreductase [archaeon]